MLRLFPEIMEVVEGVVSCHVSVVDKKGEKHPPGNVSYRFFSEEEVDLSVRAGLNIEHHRKGIK